MMHNAKRNQTTGWIAWFIKNPIAANLLMIFMLIVGAHTLLSGSLGYEIYPAFTGDTIRITTEYPGATPDQVKQGVTTAIENAISNVAGITSVESFSYEGVSLVTVTLMQGFQLDRVQGDLENAVARIASFPDDASKSRYKQSSKKRRVADVLASGDIDKGIGQMAATSAAQSHSVPTGAHFTPVHTP